MYKKDYILRLITTLTDALNEIVHGIKNDDTEDAKIKIDQCYKMLGNDSTFFLKQNTEDIRDFFDSKEEGIMDKLNLLSKIMYQDSLLENNKDQKIKIMKKSILLLEYHIDHSKEYYFEDINKLSVMKNNLKSLT
ncbi:hypothetical protein [Wenyingzhuangia sp. 2_MG-2023]|uniref:hypothetical protein n=1 Tax=Wenyingzhuangia sp. 2_MG-2023 TaxID=3062639 RepID=UPI0026E1ABC8|nr:hypothetical protein [Wenyingzhuangia sp. 2_MG-2023]MDO6736242.1 hypothetical protein [Wenyingzhuangia sp. 2_MG-2023]